MTAADEVFGFRAVVDGTGVSQAVSRVCFLKDCVAGILFVAEDGADIFAVPFAAAIAADCSAVGHDLGDAVHARSVGIHFEDLADYLGFFLDYRGDSVYEPVAKSLRHVVWEAPLPVGSLDAPGDVAADALALGLGERGVQRYCELRAGRHGVDVFLLELDGDIEFFEFAYALEAFDGVAGESAYGLAEDQVDPALFCECEHFIKLGSILHLSAADSFVSKDAGELPVLVASDQVGVVVDLDAEAVELLGFVGRDAAVGGDAELRG